MNRYKVWDLVWATLIVGVAALIIWAVVVYSNDCDARGGQVITGHQGALYCVPRVGP